MKEEWVAANRAGWNLRTPVHLQSSFYDLEGWKAGRTSLQAIEEHRWWAAIWPMWSSNRPER